MTSAVLRSANDGLVAFILTGSILTALILAAGASVAPTAI